MIMYWVSMTDNFMSSWGQADGLINKYIIECDTLEDAERIERAANERGEMSKIAIRQVKPHYPPNTHLVTWKHYDELGPTWKDK